jgi:hypothetical protein
MASKEGEALTEEEQKMDLLDKLKKASKAPEQAAQKVPPPAEQQSHTNSASDSRS